MKVHATALPEVLVLEPRVLGDERGFFLESWNARTFQDVTGVDLAFVQDNHSRSVRNVLRGIHYQLEKPQGKLVRAVSGRVWDVAVDLRRSSPNFGKWVGAELSAQNKLQLWIPPGFGHGFLVLSEYADFLYKTTQYWFADFDRSIVWNDPDIAVDWRLADEAPLLSERDRLAPRLREAQVFD
ncbi:MAG TPA: dTDP-4-dehydrorhamnose 3,5-epimerase [Burkholderiaceae bacterium]|nr:dTDP-4-dehydrorhamnose 3,5-epimerase [Burkholderiaceae bacterium]